MKTVLTNTIIGWVFRENKMIENILNLANQREMTAVAPTTSSANGGGYMTNMVVEVVGYDLKRQQMMVKDGELNFNVAISQFANKIDEAKLEEAPKFVGSLIDARMEANVKPGDKVILEGVLAYPNMDYSKPVTAKWISTAPVDPAKIVEGVMTISGRRITEKAEDGSDIVKYRASRVQIWNDQALPLTEEQVSNVAKICDSSAQKWVNYFQNEPDDRKKPYYNEGPTVGFSFRTLVENKVVDHSKVFDYAPVVINAEAPPAEQRTIGIPMTGQNFKTLAAEYAAASKEAFGDLANVEVAICKVFTASKNFNLRHGNLDTYIGTRSMPNAAAEAATVYNMLATDAVMVLSTGKYNNRGVLEGAEKNIANKVFASKGHHLHTLINSVDGIKPELAEGIEMTFPRSKKAQSGQEQSDQQSQSNVDSAKQQAPAQQAPAQQAPAQQASSQPDEEMDALQAALAAKQAKQQTPSL